MMTNANTAAAPRFTVRPVRRAAMATRYIVWDRQENRKMDMYTCFGWAVATASASIPARKGLFTIETDAADAAAILNRARPNQ